MQLMQWSYNVVVNTDLADDSELPRATQLDKLTEEELFGLPTNNLNTEKDFSKFSRLSELANFRN